MFLHNLNTVRVMTAAAPGPAARLIVLMPTHCVAGPGGLTRSVAEVPISLLAEVLICLDVH